MYDEDINFVQYKHNQFVSCLFVFIYDTMGESEGTKSN